MKETIRNEQLVWEDSYNAALALYAVLRGSHTIRVKRAEMRTGEVPAEPIDFCADLEMRASQAFPLREQVYFWNIILQDPDEYPNIPQIMKQVLGKTIERFDLGVTGHYQRLYYRIKNMSDRKRIIQDLPEEEDDGARNTSGFGTAYNGECTA